MKTVNLSALGGIFILGLILNLASCGTTSGKPGIEAMVPSDAFMVAWSNSPATFLKSINEFVKETGLDTFLEGSSVEDFVYGMSGFDGEKINEFVDFSKSSGVVLQGTAIESLSPSFLIPVKKPDAAKVWLSELVLPAGMAVDGPFNSYLVVRLATQEAQTWPPKETLAGKLSTNVPDHHLAIAMNYQVIMESEEFKSAFDVLNSDSNAYGSWVQESVEGLGWFTLSLGANKDVLDMAMDMTWDKDSSYGKVMSSYSYGKAPYTKDLVAEEFLGMAMNAKLVEVDPYMAYIKDLLDAFNLSGAELVLENLKALMTASGENLYLTLDMDLAQGMIELEGPEAYANLGLKIGGKADVKDVEAFKTALDKTLATVTEIFNPLLSGFLTSQAEQAGLDAFDWNSLYDEETGEWIGSEDFTPPEAADVEPVDFKLSFNLSKDKQGTGFTYDQYDLSTTYSGGNEAGKSMVEEVASAINAAFGSVLLSYKGKSLYYAMGPNGLPFLESLVSGSTEGTPLNSVPNYKTVASYIDEDGAMVGHLSLARIVNKVSGAAGMPFIFDEKVPGFLGSTTIKEGSMQLKLAIGAKELKTYIMQVAPLLGAFL